MDVSFFSLSKRVGIAVSTQGLVYPSYFDKEKSQCEYYRNKRLTIGIKDYENVGGA